MRQLVQLISDHPDVISFDEESKIVSVRAYKG